MSLEEVHEINPLEFLQKIFQTILAPRHSRVLPSPPYMAAQVRSYRRVYSRFVHPNTSNSKGLPYSSFSPKMHAT